MGIRAVVKGPLLAPLLPRLWTKAAVHSTGNLGKDKDNDRFQFALIKGESYVLSLSGLRGRNEQWTMNLLDEYGYKLESTKKGESYTNKKGDPIEYTAQYTGDYIIDISKNYHFGWEGGDYLFSVIQTTGNSAGLTVPSVNDGTAAFTISGASVRND